MDRYVKLTSNLVRVMAEQMHDDCSLTLHLPEKKWLELSASLTRWPYCQRISDDTELRLCGIVVKQKPSQRPKTLDCQVYNEIIAEMNAKEYTHARP